MELRYPFVLWIGLVLLAVSVIVLYRYRKNTGFSGGVKVSTAGLLEQVPEFRKAKQTARLLRILTRLTLCGMVVSALFLAAGPYETREETTTLRQRDIILCLDVSYSIYELNDALVDQLPAKFDLSFHVRLQSLLNSACSGYLDLTALNDFIAAESLQDFKPQLCMALMKAVIRFSGAAINRQQLSVLWTLMQADRATAAELAQLTCSVDECIAVITRSGVLAAYPEVYPADEDFFNLIIRLSAAVLTLAGSVGAPG